MDSFRLCLALGPVAIYLILVGVINLTRQAFLVSGTRDAVALALAVSGLIIIGPLELFYPQEASIQLGSYVWPLLLMLQVLCIVLIVLTLQPRLIVYNISADEFRPILADLVARLDAEARWAGDSVVLPTLGIQFHVNSMTGIRNVSLISNGQNQSLEGWRKLEKALATDLREFDVTRSARGMLLSGGSFLLGLGVVMVLLLATLVVADPQAIPQGLADLLRL